MKNKYEGLIMELSIGLLVVTIIGILILSIIAGIHFATNHHQVTFTVNKTERVEKQAGDGSKYMIYTDKGVFEDTDSLLNGKFNSADVYNQIKPGKKYTCDVVGFRSGFFSNFENIIKCDEVN